MPWASAISIPLMLAALSAGSVGSTDSTSTGLDPAFDPFADLKAAMGLSTRGPETSVSPMSEHPVAAPIEHASTTERAPTAMHVERRREIRWAPLKRVGVPGLEVFEVLESSSHASDAAEIAGLGLGTGAASNAPTSASNSASETQPNARATEAVTAQIDLTKSATQVDLQLSVLGGLGVQSVQSLAALETPDLASMLRDDRAMLPLVMRAQDRDENTRWIMNDKARRAAGWTLVSGGLASSALATYIALMASQQHDDDGSRNQALCKSGGCRPIGQASASGQTGANGTGRPDARAMSTALSGAGVAVLATGGLFLMTTPALSFGERARVGAAVRSMNTGFLVMTGEW